MSPFIVIGLIVSALLAYVVLRNGLVAANQRANSGWAGIEVQLKRRHDLIPSLVKAAGAAQRHERGVIDAMLASREKAVAALAGRNTVDIAAAEAALSQGLRSFLSYAEDNPEITATKNIATLQRQIEDTEDQIAAARRFFNHSVEAYNTTVESLPWNFIAAQMGMRPRAMFELAAAERTAVLNVPEIAL